MPAFPAARFTDMHTCPMVTGVVAHGGGPILPPSQMTVLIGKQPAARVTDKVTCAGPPDVIVTGSMTVLIGKKPAARQTDKTMHGGTISLGCPTVRIGGGAAGAMLGNPQAATEACKEAGKGRGSGSTKQSYGNCRLEPSRQVINNANQYGVSSKVEWQNMAAIKQAVAEGRGAITSHDVGILQNNPNYRSSHAVLTTGLEYDANGKLKNVIVNDRWTAQCGQRIPADRYEASLNEEIGLNITKNPIW